MKSGLIYLSIGSTLLNIYVNAVWTYAYFNAPTPSEAKFGFQQFFPGVLNGQYFSVFALLLTLGSIFMFSRFKTARNHLLYTGFIVVQSAFLILYAWQML